MKRNFSFRPLVTFPRPVCTRRQKSRFDSEIEQTYSQLSTELQAIKAKNAVLQMRLGADGLTTKGLPKIALPPEVVLSFELNGRAVTMPCDTFNDWRDNVRAIALSLRALRQIDRYGVTQTGEQYRGWEALPPASQDVKEDFSTREEAVLWLATVSGDDSPYLLSDSARRQAAYKVVSRRFHPDAGGEPREFRRLQNAKRILESP